MARSGFVLTVDAKVRDSQSNKLVADRSKIIYNSRITFRRRPRHGIPAHARRAVGD
jgi:hypothetical protein